MNTNKGRGVLIAAAIVALLALGAYFFKIKIGPLHFPERQDTSDVVNSNQTATEKNPSNDPIIGQLSIPDGFVMTPYAKNVKDARVMVFDPKGRMLVSETSEGRIVTLEDANEDGVTDSVKTLISGLNKPHGMAFLCNTSGAAAESCLLFIVQSSRLVSYDYDPSTGTATNVKKLIDIPSTATDRHFTRTLQLLPDNNTLLISIGSSCDVCVETDAMRGRIMAYTISTGKVSEYARGLRNSVFMTLDSNGRVFATEMGRDSLGDELPPDEINIIEPGKDYGWPNCYSQNVHDDVFDKKTYIRNPCMEPFETPSFIDLQAHSAPLGLQFIPDAWKGGSGGIVDPALRGAASLVAPLANGDLLVAYHGSWNRSTPTGYKIVRISFDANGAYSSVNDFISGWLTADGKKLGRPAGLAFGPIAGTDKQALYISDDDTGTIYKVVKE